MATPWAVETFPFTSVSTNALRASIEASVGTLVLSTSLPVYVLTKSLVLETVSLKSIVDCGLTNAKSPLLFTWSIFPSFATPWAISTFSANLLYNALEETGLSLELETLDSISALSNLSAKSVSTNVFNASKEPILGIFVLSASLPV